MKIKKSSLEKNVDKMIYDFCSNLDKEINVILITKKPKKRDKYPCMSYLFYCMYERTKNNGQ